MKAQWYPLADTTTQNWDSAFERGTFTAIDKVLLHTTETAGWPGYKGGATAPTLTYFPKARKWRQHNKIGSSARALSDPAESVVRENRDNVVQIEIIAYADEKVAASVTGAVPVSRLTDDNYKDLGEFVKWLRKEWGGPPLVTAKFIPYPESYGDSSVRMSGPEYDAFRGILGHQHAPANNSWGNRHGDPGAINGAKIIAYAASEVKATPVAGTVVLTVDSKHAIRRLPVALTATVTPSNAKGAVSFQWYAGATWKEIDRVTLDAKGKATITNAPWNDVIYRAVFVSADATRWTNDSSANVTVKVLTPDAIAAALNG